MQRGNRLGSDSGRGAVHPGKGGGKAAAPSTGAVMGGRLCPTVFTGSEMAKGTLAPTETPRHRLGGGENSKACGDVCGDSHSGWKRVGQDLLGCPTSEECSQNESQLLPSPASRTDLSPPAAGAVGQGGPGWAVKAGLRQRERRARDALPPPDFSRAHASISSFARDRPWCCRSMQINAKLIRVINSAVPQRSYRQGFR